MNNTAVLHLVLLVFALVFACVAAFWNPQPSPSRVHFGWLALTVFIASFISW